MVVSPKALRIVLDTACSVGKRLNGTPLNELFEAKDLAAWCSDVQTDSGRRRLARLLDREFNRRGENGGSIILLKKPPKLVRCLFVVEVRPKNSIQRFYIGCTEEEFLTNNEPGA